MSSDAPHLAELLPSFTIRKVPYKTVGGHAVEASVWLPKLDDAARAQPRPVCVTFHGGGFVGGSRRSLAWMAVWQVELMRARGAVVSTTLRAGICSAR
jgi:acetyl esterase/lipase